MKKNLLLSLIIIGICSCGKKNKGKNGNITADSIFAKYVKALGGTDNLRNIKTSISSKKSYVNGKYFCTTTIYIHYPDKVAIQYDYSNGLHSLIRFDGKEGTQITPSGQTIKLNQDVESLKQIAYLFPELYYIDNKYTFKIASENKQDYEIKISKGKFSTSYFIDKSTFLVTKVKNENSETFTIKDTIISGIEMPYISKTLVFSYPKDTVVNSYQLYKLNTAINDTVFNTRK
ncbi:MAG TPA: hypothetical protein VNG53_00165 [Bacteroidia bacterium]|nr:hypothetical protein [Bacteroidia bacterium]